MSIAVRNYLREYVSSVLDIYYGTNFFESLDDEKQNNINRSVEMILYNRLRPAGAAPPRRGDSETCKKMLEVLQTIPERKRIELVKSAIDDYILLISSEDGNVIGDYADDLLVKREERKKIILEVE